MFVIRTLWFLWFVAVFLTQLGCQNSLHVSPVAAVPLLPTATLLRPNRRSAISPFVPFSWQPVQGAIGYYLQVGRTQGDDDVFAVGELPATVTSWPVGNLLPGPLYWARLFTQSGAGWGYVDVPFRVVPQPNASDTISLYSTVEQLTSSVRMSADPTYNRPLPGSALAVETAIWGRPNAVCVDYAYTLVQLLQTQHIYARSVTLTMVGGTALGHTVVEFYDPVSQKWSVADPTFGAIYYDDSTQAGQSALELSGYVFTESWGQIHPRFVTPNGDLYMRNYYLDPVTLYLNVVQPGETSAQSMVHDPRQFLIPVTLSANNPHGYYIFAFSAAAANVLVDNPPGSFSIYSGTLNADPLDSDPLDSSEWSNTFALNDGWSISLAPPNVQTYTFRRVMF